MNFESFLVGLGPSEEEEGVLGLRLCGKCSLFITNWTEKET